jgi:hypothetical protein
MFWPGSELDQTGQPFASEITLLDLGSIRFSGHVMILEPSK